MLILWWWILVDPLMNALRISTAFSMQLFLGSATPISVDPSGDWNFEVPLELDVRGDAAGAAGARIHSMEFTAPRAGMLIFTLSLPLFWALALATPSTRRNWRRLVLGSVVVWAIETFSLLAIVRISARAAAEQWQPMGENMQYLRTIAHYIIVQILPYVSPFFVLISLDRDLRSNIFRREILRQAASISLSLIQPGCTVPF